MIWSGRSTKLYPLFLKEIRRFYGTLIGTMALSTSLFATFRFSTKEENNVHKRIGLLETLYLAMAFIAMAPTLHWIQAITLNNFTKISYIHNFIFIN